MPFRQFSDGNGSSITLFEYNGRLLTGPPRHWHDITNMTSRPDDVLICGYPKSGLHWVWEIVTMLVNGTAYLTDNRMELHGFLMLSSLDQLEKLPSPRVLTTHRSFHDLPSDFIKRRRKIVCVLRDPKDVCVSYYHMMTSVERVHYEGTIGGFVPLFLEGKVPFGSWADWVRNFEKGLVKHPELTVHTVHYEQLKMNPVKEIQKLAQYLGVSPTLAEQVAEKTNFTLMKQFKESIPNPFSKAYKNNRDTIFRKGESGLWHQWFTEEQALEFEAYLQKKLNSSEFKAKL